MADNTPTTTAESEAASEVPKPSDSADVNELAEKVEECSVKEADDAAAVSEPQAVQDIGQESVEVKSDESSAPAPDATCPGPNDEADNVAVKIEAEVTSVVKDNLLEDTEAPPDDPSGKSDEPAEEKPSKTDEKETDDNDDSSQSTDAEEDSVAGDDEAKAEETKEDDKEEDSLDADEIRTNPAYIPKTGQFYMHDTRSGRDDESATEVEDPSNKRQSRADGKWAHDLFDEKRQQPKSNRELSNRYGFDVRRNDKEQTDAPVPRGGGRRRDFGDRNQNPRPSRPQHEGNDQIRPRGGSGFRGAPRGRTFKRTVVSSTYSRDNNQSRGNQRPQITRSTLNNEDEFPTLDAARALPKRETRAPRRTEEQTGNERRPPQNRQGPRKFDGHRQTGPTNSNFTNGPQATSSAQSQQATDSQQNSRLRQPTDAVYFDPQPPTKTLPPRERRRLQFTAPSN